LLFHIFRLAEGKHYLLLGRTNWQLGKKDIKLLFLCVAYKKIALLLFWLVLKKGKFFYAKKNSADLKIYLYIW